MDNKVLNLIGLACRSRNISAGTDTCLVNIKSKKAFLVFIAKDASLPTQKKIIDKCNFYNVQYNLSFDSDTLSNAIGKEAIKVITINDIGFSNNIKNILKESVNYEG